MISVIDNFLTDKECDEYINLIESKLHEKNVPFSNSSGGFNHKYIDHDLANEFLERVFKHDYLNKEINTANNLIMMSKYNKGENFGIHTDTGLYYDRISKRKTRYTLLIYLNDDFEGGKTIFYSNDFKINKIISPKRGSCLLFDIDLWHEGCKVVNGTKYWIGCEIIGPMII